MMTFPVGEEFTRMRLQRHKAQAEQPYAEKVSPLRLLPPLGASASGALIGLDTGQASIQSVSGGILLVCHGHFYHAASMQDCEGCAYLVVA
jgi:hypothetical protein